MAERYPATRGYPLARVKRDSCTAGDLSGTSAARLSTPPHYLQ
jgi:hypothetical protein